MCTRAHMYRLYAQSIHGPGVPACVRVRVYVHVRLGVNLRMSVHTFIGTGRKQAYMDWKFSFVALTRKDILREMR
jgi:hypothetical protein